MANSVKYLLVIHGTDAGARLVLSEQGQIVGRAQDAQLILTDPSVSRYHFHVRAVDGGAQVHLCSGAASLVHNGQAIHAAEIRIGESFVVGSTLLLVVEGRGLEPARQSAAYESTTTTVGALLNGAAGDAQGLAAIFALNEALLSASDFWSVETAVVAWAGTYATCEAIELSPAGVHFEASSQRQPVLEMPTPKGGTRILVPAVGAPTGWLAFTTALPSPRVTDVVRRLLAVAASLCGARLSQLAQLRITKEENETLRRQVLGSAHAFLGKSAAAEHLARTIPKLAASDVTVLLTGETGVGKSFVARLIHESGPRKDQPFRAINCASIPENLIESELFGHERGAFTGAVSTHLGAFETAGRGTLFLDEIGELLLAGQAKLLRVLEARQYERVGSTRSITLEARIIAATNRDLEAMVAAGTFRRDLFFRISVLKAAVPPLRERGEDLLLLARQILADLAPSAGRRVEGFSSDALDAIERYSWPGNVRELRNAIEHALVLGEGSQISATDLSLAQPPMDEVAPDADAVVVRLPAPLEWLERRAVEAALQETGGNQTKAAALLGISRNTLAKKMREGTA